MFMMEYYSRKYQQRSSTTLTLCLQKFEIESISSKLQGFPHEALNQYLACLYSFKAFHAEYNNDNEIKNLIQKWKLETFNLSSTHKPYR